MDALEGARVRLRPWSHADVDAVHEACQDPEIPRWTTVPSPYRREDAVGFVDEYVPSAAAEGGVALAVEDRAAGTGVAVGSISVLHVRGGVGEIGYWMAAPARGRGLARDALDTLARWCFTRPDPVARLELLVLPGNAASLAVAGHAGFVVEGLLRARVVCAGEHHDAVLLSRLPTD